MARFLSDPMHYKRLLIALIFIPLLYMYVMYLPEEYYLFLMICCSTLGLAEFYSFSKVSGTLKYAGLISGIAILIVFFIAKDQFINTIVFTVMFMTGLRLFTRRNPVSSISDVSVALFGLMYIPVLLAFQLQIIKVDPAWIVLLYAGVWGSDSMAYYLGKSIGKRKLYIEISPNKTVEGAAGSVIGGIIGSILIKSILLKHVTIQQAVIIGVAIGLSTIVGDLVESMFKRDAGVKDSSSMLPGHGGMLDKLDSVTFAGPVFYWSCRILGLI